MRLISVTHLRELIREEGLDHFLRQTIDALESTFRRWHEFHKSPRHAIHYPHGVIELMPCSDDSFYSVKYVNGHPGNTARGKPSIAAIGLLAEVEGGLPLMISEMTLLTAIRTAATGALAARYLARPRSRCLALVGTGAQAEFQLLALQQELPIEAVRFHDTDPKAMQKFARNVADRVELIPCQGLIDTLKGADLLITATADRRHNPMVRPEMIHPGLHINAIGGDCPGKTELAPELLEHCRIVVEYLPQSQQEGEIQQLKEAPQYSELWQLVTGEAPGRQNAQELTLFDSVGFAIEDYALLRLVYEMACERGIGEEVGLLPTPSDPKDLYGLL